MTTAEATIAALIAHGIDTIYALPGVHNDHLFDALFKAGDDIAHHPRAARAGRRLSGARRRTRDGEAPGLHRGAGAGPAQFFRCAAHCLRNERAGARADRTDPTVRDRPRARAPARDSRPGRHHLPPRGLFGPHPRTGGGGAARGASHPGDGDRPARTRGARMRHRRVGAKRTGRADRRAVAARRTGRSTRTRSATPPSGSARRSARSSSAAAARKAPPPK